jgi:glycosyltransferase involved in cell wall biosynthesis
MKPSISVLMSSYNDEKFIDESIQSILKQDFKDFEFIIVNDGSTDNTPKIIRKYAKKDKRIVAIDNQKNIGIVKSLNKGLKIAKGRYVARMDADDVALPERLGIQYRFIEKHPEIFLVGAFLTVIDHAGVKVGATAHPTTHEKIVKCMEKRCCMSHNTIMFRNDGTTRYRTKMWYVEDYDLYLRTILEGKKLANIPLPLLKYRRNPNSVSFSKRTKQILFTEKAREFYQERKRSGKDSYASFDDRKILKMDMENCTEPSANLEEIKMNFALDDLAKTRSLIQRYYKNHGRLHRPALAIYLFATYLDKRLVRGLKRTIKFTIGKY